MAAIETGSVTSLGTVGTGYPRKAGLRPSRTRASALARWSGSMSFPRALVSADDDCAANDGRSGGVRSSGPVQSVTAFLPAPTDDIPSGPAPLWRASEVGKG